MHPTYTVITVDDEIIYVGKDIVEAKKESIISGQNCRILSNGSPILAYDQTDGWRGV